MWSFWTAFRVSFL